ncbi:cytochrome P450 [Actinomycetospora sp. C-140]
MSDGAAVSGLDPDVRSPFELDPGAMECPHRYYEGIRDQGVYFVESIDSWLVTGSDDIREVLADTTRFSHRYPAGPQYAQMMRGAMSAALSSSVVSPAAQAASDFARWEVLFTADPPEHERHRRLVAPSFSPRQVKAADDEVREIAENLIARFVEAGESDIVRDFCWPLPLEAIARRLGVPLEEMPRFRRWSEDMAVMLGNNSLDADRLVSLLESLGEFHAFFAEAIAEAIADPQDNVLGVVAQAHEELTEREMVGILVQFLFAGNGTTTNLIASGVLRLARDRDLADRLRADPSLTPAFVEEVLRLDVPVQGAFRRAKQDVVLSGTTIPAGAHVFLPFVAANRDPLVYAEPDELSLQRRGESPHLSFGRGSYYCLGAPLARLEAQIAFDSLLARLDDLEVVEGSVQYNPSFMVHEISTARIRFVPRGVAAP